MNDLNNADTVPKQLGRIAGILVALGLTLLVLLCIIKAIIFIWGL